MKMKKNNLMIVTLVALLSFTVSCASSGNLRVSLKNANKIKEGHTTKNEIIYIFGHPDRILNFDKKCLYDYVYRIHLTSLAEEDIFPEDNYEVWTYNKWRHTTGPLPYTSRETQQNCTFIINSKGICVKKFYSKKSRFIL